MTAIFQTNQPSAGKTTVRFTYWADTAKLSAILDRVALNMWNRKRGFVGASGEFVPFANLTNQQRLNLVDAFIQKTISDLSLQNRHNVAGQAAKAGVDSTPDEDKFD